MKLLVTLVFTGFLSLLSAQEVVNLYTHRHYEADTKLFQSFTEKTGIKVNVVKAGADELIERLKAEGENSPADLLITVDAGRLHKAKELGLFQSIEAPEVISIVPEQFRDTDNQWIGLTKRARIAVVRKNEKPNNLSTYEDLAKPEHKGSILIRSSSNIYNQSLLASIIAANGEATAKAWAQEVQKNMARPPQGSDRDQVRAMVAGLGDIAIVNTYYLGILANSSQEKDRKVAEKIEVVWLNQEDRGAHFNVSGAGLLKGSKNKKNALALLAFLTSKESQQIYAESNSEYPIRSDVAGSELLQAWGEFKMDTLPLSKLGELNANAVKIFGEVGWE